MKDIFNKISQDSKLVGVSAVIVKDGKIVEELNYGYSSLENITKAKSTTVYRIASISKMIVALAVMRLYEMNLISLDTDISDYLGFRLRNPKFPNKIITIKMMMTQTSSITDGAIDESNGYNAVNGTDKNVYLKDLILTSGSHYCDDTFDNNEPGTKFIYSNFNCGILACIVEKLSNTLFTDFVRQEVLLPLGLDASFKVTDIQNEDIATLYVADGDNVKISRTGDDFKKRVYPTFPIGENYRGPAGGLFINMLDLSRLMNIFMNNGYPLFKQETIKLMLETHWQGEGEGCYRAKGLQIQILNYFENKTLKGHFGDAYGVKSFMLFNEDKHIGICYITNGGHFKYQASGIADIHEQIIEAFIKKYRF